MRECENLIDSLVYYIRGAVADHKSDDKVKRKFSSSYNIVFCDAHWSRTTFYSAVHIELLTQISLLLTGLEKSKHN